MTTGRRPDGVPRRSRNHPFSHSLRYAVQGVRYTWRTQRNFRTESTIGLLAVAACLVLGVNPAPVLVCAALVLSLELVNTASRRSPRTWPPPPCW